MTARTFAMIAAFAFASASGGVAVWLGHPLAAWGCGLLGGASLVLANVLTHPLLFRWDA